jgi:hypothetical protein
VTPPVGPRADVDVDASWRSVYLHGALPAEGPIAPHEEANSSVFQKLSVCELELDAWAEDIANPRLRLSPRPSTGGISAIPSLMALWEVCAQLHAVLAASHECVCVCSRCTQDEHARREAAGVATLLSPVALTAAQGAGREPIDVWRVELACLWLRPPPIFRWMCRSCPRRATAGGCASCLPKLSLQTSRMRTLQLVPATQVPVQALQLASGLHPH